MRSHARRSGPRKSPAQKSLGPILLAPGIEPRHALSYLFAALVSIGLFTNGLGSVVFFVGLTRLPLLLERGGADQIWAVRLAFLAVGAIAALAAVVMLGLKPGRPAAIAARTPLLRLMSENIAAARRPRIALCYGGAFAARADMAIVTLFVTLWVAQAATAAGMTPTQAAARAGMVVGITQGAALIWSPVFGVIGDRINRLTRLIKYRERRQNPASHAQ